MSMKRNLIMVMVGVSLWASGAYAADRWPDLPIGVKNGVAVQSGNHVYVGLGSAGKKLFRLDLGNLKSGWQEMAEFPGPAMNGAPAALSEGSMIVFGGAGKVNADAKSPIIFDSIYSYDLASDRWKKHDVKSPVGLLGASALPMDGGKVALIGGYNKSLFDQYLSDVLSTDKEKEADKWNRIVGDYMGMKPADYRWNKDVLSFDPTQNAWSTLGENPYLPNTGSAIVPTSKASFLVINGEIKPGLRTPKVKEIAFNGDKPSWSEKTQIPPVAGDELQEGLAGAYAGYSGDVVLVAGGANFKGARARSIAEKWYTHEGYPKRWNRDVYAMISNGWSKIGDLPEGLAYGASFSIPEGVLIVGGEDGERKARTNVFLMKWGGGKLSFED